MKEWLLKGDHKGKNDLFLQSLFNLWITSVPPTNSKIREAIWTRFSQFTSSSEYTNFWACLYADAKIPGSNVLSFYLTYYYFIRCWIEVYPTRNSPCIHETSVSPDEENALWYVGGYIIRKIRNKSLKVRDILNTFIEDYDYDDDNTTAPNDTSIESESEWFNTINRGGLIKCTNGFYQFLRTLETEIQTYLNTIPAAENSHSLGQPKEVVSKIIKPHVSDAWKTLLASEIEEVTPSSTSTTDVLLTEIIELYSRVRFFAFVDRKMEHFKKEKKEQLQKAKSLRSKLNAQ